MSPTIISWHPDYCTRAEIIPSVLQGVCSSHLLCISTTTMLVMEYLNVQKKTLFGSVEKTIRWNRGILLLVLIFQNAEMG